MTGLKPFGFAAVLLLGGCGQKGALYLPEPARTVVPGASDSASSASTPPAAATPSKKDPESNDQKPATGSP